MRPLCGQGLEPSTMLLYGGHFGPNERLQLPTEQRPVSIIAKTSRMQVCPNGKGSESR